MTAAAEAHALVPKLRFPEFLESWSFVTISKFFDFTEKVEKTTTFDKDKVLTVKLHAGGIVKNEKATLTGKANYFNRKVGQFIFSKIDLLNGAFGVIPEPLDGFASSSDVPAYSFNAEHSSMFFVNWLKAKYEHLEIERTGTSSTLKRVSPEKFLALAIPVPTLNEQQKIADCLASIDELITLESQKLDTLKRHKKGLMQQLFPAEGETVPRLRFPEFRDAGEWNVKNLKNVCEVNPSNAVLPEKFVYIDLEAVEAGKLKLRKIIYQEEAPSRAQRLLRYGDVIFQMVRPYQRNNLHFKINEEIPYVASTGYAQLRANESEDFLFQAVHTDGFVEQVIAKCTGSSYPAINSSDLAELPLAIPQKAEQQKIADCLTSLDDRIAAQNQKIDALKTHKKGLMQQLFPAPDGFSAAQAGNT